MGPASRSAPPLEASGTTGVDNGQDEDAPGSGAVYVFARSGMTWTQEAYITASNANAFDLFGFSVALAADGASLAVGAPQEASTATGRGGNQGNNGATSSGAVYECSRVMTTWTQRA